MARDPSLLTSTAPTAIAPAQVLIGHVQLRDLIICPRERGVVNYVQHQSIVQHNIHKPDSLPRTLVDLSFNPNTLASLPIAGTDDTLLAAGGQEAEIHLSYHAPLSSRHSRSGLLWQYEYPMNGSINNSVLLTSLSLTRSNQSSVEPRVGISNNDCTVKFYDVPIRGPSKRSIDEVGNLRLDVPVNHSSISPDGRTLLSVGDSSKVYLHQITGGARITFSAIATLNLPPPDISSLIYPSSSLAASFSTAFSSDGSKFAVASQEGVLAVWDVRSTKPLKVFQTEKSRTPGGDGGATGWLSDDPWEWTRGNSKAPGWSVRNVKFGGGRGKEVMTFTEHTTFLHVVDARTFETEEVVRVPTVRGRTAPQSQPLQTRPQQPQHHHHHYPRPAMPTHRHVLSSYSSPTRVDSASPPRHSIGPSPRRSGYQSQPHIVQALGDTFRIPSPYSPSPYSRFSSTFSSGPDTGIRTLRLSGSNSNIPEEQYDEILVIPPLGDRDVESDVQALLGSHGIRTRQQSQEDLPILYLDEEDANTGSTHADYEYSPRPNGITSFVGDGRGRGGGDEMEVDELESDCISSHTPSRSSSPSPSSHMPPQASPTGIGRFDPPAAGASTDRTQSRTQQQEIAYEDDLDLAGTCFSPCGGYVYAASTEGVVEWGVRGANKTWWFESDWL